MKTVDLKKGGYSFDPALAFAEEQKKNEGIFIVQKKMEDKVAQLIKFLLEQKRIKKEVDLLEYQVNKEILQVMEKYGITKIQFDGVDFIYVPAYEKKVLNTAKIKAERPEIYDEFSTVRQTNSSLRTCLTANRGE